MPPGNGKTETIVDKIINESVKFDSYYDTLIVMTPTHAQKDECVDKLQKRRHEFADKNNNPTIEIIDIDENGTRQKGSADLSSNRKIICVKTKREDDSDIYRFFSTIDMFIFNVFKYVKNNSNVEYTFSNNDNQWVGMCKYIIQNIVYLSHIGIGNYEDVVTENDIVYLICDEVQNMPYYKILSLLSLVSKFPNWKLKLTGDHLQKTLNDEYMNIYECYTAYIKNQYNDSYLTNNELEIVKNILGSIDFTEGIKCDPYGYHKRSRNKTLVEYINRVLNNFNIFETYIDYNIKPYNFYEDHNPSEIWDKNPVININYKSQNESSKNSIDVDEDNDNDGIYKNGEIKRMANDILSLIFNLINNESVDKHGSKTKYNANDILLITPSPNSNTGKKIFTQVSGMLLDLNIPAVIHKSEDGQPIDLTESENAVRMMSIQGSQGTGRKICILVDLSEQNLIYHNAGRESIKYHSFINVSITRALNEFYYFGFSDDYISSKLKKSLHTSADEDNDFSNMIACNSIYKIAINNIQLNSNNSEYINLYNNLLELSKSNPLKDMAHHTQRYELLRMYFDIILFEQSLKNLAVKPYPQMIMYFRLISTFNLKETTYREYTTDKTKRNSNTIWFLKSKDTYDFMKVCFRLKEIITSISNHPNPYIQLSEWLEKQNDIVSCSLAFNYMIEFLRMKDKKYSFFNIEYPTIMRTFNNVRNEESKCSIYDKFWLVMKNSLEMMKTVESLEHGNWISNWQRNILYLCCDKLIFKREYSVSFNPVDGKIWQS
jgi:hypothetical protein